MQNSRLSVTKPIEYRAYILIESHRIKRSIAAAFIVLLAHT